MRSARAALAVGLGLVVVAVGAVLSESPRAVLATNSTTVSKHLYYSNRRVRICQAGERLPRGTNAVRLSLGAFTGPKVTLEARSRDRVVTAGESSSGWAGETVTIPVREVYTNIAPVEICFALDANGDENVSVNGTETTSERTAVPSYTAARNGRVTIEDLGSAARSWLSLTPSLARHIGLGRAWGGPWIAPLVAILMLLTITLTARLLLREHDG